jgi:predicted dehydrogenase
MKRLLFFSMVLLFCLMSVGYAYSQKNIDKIKLITLDPGHFHAALIQKKMYADIDKTVHVYAPTGLDLEWHNARINGYNTRALDPTSWNTVSYSNHDFFEKMIAQKKGNVVVLSGNNEKKIDYILKAIENGYHVLADKPVVINADGYKKLDQAYALAKKKNLLIYDIMTERFEITNLLQKEIASIPSVFGKLEKGSIDNPAIIKESVHHFYKNVSGSVLTRPAWFFDTKQQGEGVVDVTTHLIDLVQWAAAPNQALVYGKNVKVLDATRWPTDIAPSEFKQVTKLVEIPSYLKSNTDSMLHVYCNGTVNLNVNGVHAKTTVTWLYKDLKGGGDSHYSIMKGTNADLEIKQGKEENYKPTLYIKSKGSTASYAKSLRKQIEKLSLRYPGVTTSEISSGLFKVNIPKSYDEGHEAHFGRVVDNFINYYKIGKLPTWEEPNIKAKYKATTEALKKALLKK